LNWRRANPLLLGDGGAELGFLGLKLYNLLKCDFA